MEQAPTRRSSATPPVGRVEWIDVVKGAAISLVVYGHVMQGAATSGLIAPGGFYAFSDPFVYSFHMPAFFFISGLLVVHSLQGPLGKYIGDKAATVAWPYVVWAPLNLLAFAIFSRFYHHPVAENPLRQLASFLWDPGTFWFLHALFCIQLFVGLFIWLRIETLLLFSLVAFTFADRADFPVLGKFLFFLPFFLIGACFGSRLGTYLQRFRWPLIGGLFVFVFQGLWISGPLATLRFSPLILGITGTIGLILLAHAAHGQWVARVLQRLGAASLGIFLLHPYLQGLSREVLKRIPLLNNGFSVVLQVIAAIGLSVFLYEWLMQGMGRYLFTLRPKKKKDIN